MLSIETVRACTLCAKALPFDPKPILQFEQNAKLLIIGQAPGVKAHEKGVPWDDASGIRLRDWLGITPEQFYSDRVAILPMGFCYPGKGKSGDLPPRPECAQKWHAPILAELRQVKLTILVGLYAQRQFLNTQPLGNLTETVRDFRHFLPDYFPLPHPSPRNNIWLKKHPWFVSSVLPELKERTKLALETQ